jgi:hypothetical protein
MMIREKVYSKGVRLLVISSLLITTVSAGSQKMQRIATGTWGGQHVQVDVTSKSASIEFDCAHGTIEGPLMIDSKGQFSLKGTFAMERGGPTRSDDAASSGRPATYSGSIKGKTMKLTVKLADDDQVLDTFELSHGSPGRLRKCL